MNVSKNFLATTYIFKMHKLNKKGRKKLTHLSDLDIANQSTLQPIKDIAASVGISDTLETLWSLQS
ncbi:hypothetical protein ACVXZZ_00375 [Staphylococcus aureus]